MPKLIRGLRSPAAPVVEEPWAVAAPNTYQPPRMLSFAGWNQYTAATTAQLQNYLDGTVPMVRPAVLWLDKGTVYTVSGRLVITSAINGNDGDWLYVMSNGVGSLSPEGTRYNRAVDNAHAATIMHNPAGGQVSGCITLTENVRQIRFVGLRITSNGSVLLASGLTQWGRKADGDAIDNHASLPDEIVVDRCHIHGPDSNWNVGQRDCMQVHCNRFAVIESDVRWARGYGESYGSGTEAHAILIPWPCARVTIWNNYLEGSGMSLLTGGNTHPYPNEQLTDLDIRYNTCTKDRIWDDTHPDWHGGVNLGGVIKNLIELKLGQRVLVTANSAVDLYRYEGQQGRAFTLKNANQDGNDPWQNLVDVKANWNYFAHNFRNWSLGGADGTPPREVGATERFEIVDNFFGGTNPSTNYGSSLALSIHTGIYQDPVWNPTAEKKLRKFRFLRNTSIGRLLDSASSTSMQCTFGSPEDPSGKLYEHSWKNNVFDHGSLGWKADLRSPGDVTLNAMCPEGYEWADNVVYGPESGYSPTGSIELASIHDVGFQQSGDVTTWNPYGSFEIQGPYAGYGVDWTTLMSKTSIARLAPHRRF